MIPFILPAIVIVCLHSTESLPLASNLTMTLDVPFGRSVSLKFDDLFEHLQVDSTNPRCQLKIAPEPIYLRFGNVSRKEFGCSDSRVTYSHHGFESPNQDTVKFRVSYFTETELIQHTFYVIFNILDDRTNNLVGKAFPLRVTERSRLSSAITPNTLKLNQEELPDYCHVHLVKDTRFPRFGRLTIPDNGQLTCAQFLAGDVRYERTSDSYNMRDYVILKLETVDSNGIPAEESFQITVQLEHGREPEPPQIAFSSTLLLDVQNFVIGSISREILLAEGSDDDLIFHITQPSDPSNGFLIRLEDPLHPIDSFTQQDVNAMKIGFRPPLIDSNTDRLVEIILEIVDADGLASDPVLLMIVIHPASYYAPFVVFNTGLTLFEGQSAILSSRRNLAVADEDNYDQMTLRVVSGLAHGKLVKGGESIKKFSVQELDGGQVMYRHDGSNTNEDSIVLQLNDGEHQVELLVAITIIPVDDEPPVLLKNTGIVVNQPKQVLQVTNRILEARDLDAQNPIICYNVSSTMYHGFFALHSGNEKERVESWTQNDIDEGRLFYHNHMSDSQRSSTWFVVDFTLQDGSNPPNVSPASYSISISFVPKDVSPPKRAEDATFSLRVNQSDTAVIGSKVVHYLDDFSRDKHLIISVQKGPFLGSLQWRDGREGQPTRFPQSALTYGEIFYQAPQLAENVTVLRDELVMSVRDRAGNELKDETLEIFIEAPRARKPRFSNRPPAVWSKVMLVKEGQLINIDSHYLLISDPDTQPQAIAVKVNVAPSLGNLFVRNESITVGDQFTAEDVLDQQLSYRNNHAKSAEDLIRLSITDGEHEEVLIDVHIRVVPSPTTPAPQKVLGLSKLGIVISVPEDTSFPLTRSAILGSAQIANYPPSDLTFHLDQSLQNGLLLVNGTPTETFSWRDVEYGFVVYQSKTKSENSENTIFDDNLSLKVAPITDEWVLGDKLIDHLEIQILLMPKAIVIRPGKAFVVNEGQSTVLTEEHLTVPPRNQKALCTLLGSSVHGDIVDTVRGVVVSQFSNLDLFERRIHYNQSVHHRSEPRTDSLKLSCNGHYVELTITIVPINDEEPVLLGDNIEVSVGDEILVGGFISIIDADEPADELKVQIVEFPDHGVIMFNYTAEDPNEIQIEPAFRLVREFLASSLRHPCKILYRHDGSKESSDQFIVRVTDGVHHVEKKIFVTVLQREQFFDDGSSFGIMEYIPRSMELIGQGTETILYETNGSFPMKGAMELEPTTTTAVPVKLLMPTVHLITPESPLTLLPNKQLGLSLSMDWMNISRNETCSQKELLIEIVRKPKYGSFIDPQNAERIYNIFPEGVLNETDKRQIAYALSPQFEKMTQDTFAIQAIDEFGDRSPVIEGVFRWSWMSFIREKYETSENNGVVKIGVKRRGWLQNRDFVAVKARDLSATMGKDYKEDFALQAEFQPGQSESFIEIKLMKDELYENKEAFQLVLDEPQSSNIETPWVTTVVISDQDESPMVFIPHPRYMIKETIGTFNLTLKRTGRDLNQAMSVICYTTDGSATGTISRTYQMFRPDFITRLNIHSSAVTFHPNQTTAVCPIVIVNDGHAEPEESFLVTIRPLGPTRVGLYSQTEVVIIRDFEDEPRVTFTKPQYEMTFLDSIIDIEVQRSGGDMHLPSEVDLLGEDGEKLERVYFAPGELSQKITLKKLDNAKRKGDFRIMLNGSQYMDSTVPTANIHVQKRLNFTAVSSVGGGLSDNEIVLLSNYDSPVEVPELSYDCLDCGFLSPPTPSSHQAAAPVTYQMIPQSNAETTITSPTTLPSVIESIEFFPKEETDKEDLRAKEKLLDVLEGLSADHPVSRGPVIASRSSRDQVTPARKQEPKIRFGAERYEVVEPFSAKRLHWITIPIIREGDFSTSDIVRIITRDGTAKAGVDFEPLDTVVNFPANRSHEIVQIRIIHDNIREPSENFTVHIYTLRRTRAQITKGMAVVVINEQSGENVRFPGPPLVTSLQNYEEPVLGGWIDIAQPAVCITTCNPRHPDYTRTRKICEMEDIDDSKTIFEWRVSHPLSDMNYMEPVQHLRTSAWLADTTGPVLDSIYFSNGSLVLCSARAVTTTGHGGYETESPVVTVVSMTPKCPTSTNAAVADPFKASISSEYNGSITISVSIPHRHGLLPLVSTSPISDLQLLLPSDGTRTVEHVCSNMVSSSELRATRSGFLKPVKEQLTLRGNKTDEFYANLNNCEWLFEATYSLSELTEVCGGKILTDRKNQASDGRRELTIRVPLHVSYAYFTNAFGTPWKHYDQSTTLDLIYVYDSVKSWFGENSAMEKAAEELRASEYTADQPAQKYSAEIRVIQAKVSESNAHVDVKFTTKPHFRGKFLNAVDPDGIKANVRFPARLKTEFELVLLRTQENEDYPQQLWRFRTIRSFKMGYLGVYNVSLVPCEFTQVGRSTCESKPIVTFQVPVSESS